MYTIAKEFHFSASHQLSDLPDCHPCARLHGHNYVVVVELAAQQLDEHGFVLDFYEFKSLKAWIDDTLDHRHLNDVFGHNKVTSEVLAKEVFDWAKQHWPHVSAVRVSETPKTWAEYRP